MVIEWTENAISDKSQKEKSCPYCQSVKNE
jgi:hypothetical protein